ncbi:glycosyl hydrolase family 28-related protein [Shimia biformata]|uniref:glycosyl hydrolase family 28-related protein n=1 Tax=Shimia biformata TaxID=1294299 RepID=UPI00194DF680|nr:glycosyl hydrolase family 28-related protein [Shimia biformata]
MNKAITDGVLLMPPQFAQGLDVWSSGNGTPGADTYDGDPNAAFVPADQDFGGCIEILKTNATQKLRYMGETPLLAGCYLRVTARVKAVSGNLPNVRVAAWAGASGGTHVDGVTEVGPSVPLTTYGEVVEVSAIIGAGNRAGVDMVWGADALYGHFGIDLTGASGGVVRIDDIVIEDITHVFHRTMMNWVDVRDFGAVGDGVTDDAAAFEAADAAAAGRRVLISEGTYFLGTSVTFDNHVEFEGTVTMASDDYLTLTKDFHLSPYIDAFGSEEEGFKRAFQALLNNADHESLDLGGRRISISQPIDMAAAVGNKDEFAQRRVIRNGQLYVTGTSVWDPEVVTSQATYSASASRTLTNVVNVANIPVGSLVTGNGVGREVYVKSKNLATQEITLSQPLFDGEGTQNFTFTRFKYLLDFSNFKKLASFSLADIEFQCNSKASGIMLAPNGLIFHLKDCWITRPRDRGVTSIGDGCQGMLIDRCNFATPEGDTPAQDRTTVAINTNANDVKIRNNRASQFRHFVVIGGANSIITGNHFFQGDAVSAGLRTAGIVLTQTHCSTLIDGNYCDNAFIEWTNEYDPSPNFTGGYSFSALSITDNVFLSGDVAPWFSYIVVKPHGAGHFLAGLTVTGNKFRSINGPIDRVERIDTSFADLDMSKGKLVLFEGNTYNAVETPAFNPLVITHSENSASATWDIDTEGKLPFGGRARGVDSLIMLGKIKNQNNVGIYSAPYVSLEQGANGDHVHVSWETPVHGDVVVTVRMDSV